MHASENRHYKNFCARIELDTEWELGALFLECHNPSLQVSLSRKKCSCLADQDAQKRVVRCFL